MNKISRRLFLKEGSLGLASMAIAPGIISCSQNDEYTIRKSAPLAGKYDVVVCGGGPAGFIAAITAARQGVKTAIIERYGFFGGMATTGYVAPISVFALKNELVIGGIPWEFVKRLEQMGGAFIEWPKANIDFDIELYKLCCQRMILEAGVDIYTHSTMIGCEMEGKKITSVIIENQNGLETLEGKVFLDCTGDGDLAWTAKVPMQPNPDGELQPCSFGFVLSGVDTESELLNKCLYHNGINGPSQCRPVREKLLAMKKAGADLPDFGGPWFNNMLRKGTVMVNMTRRAADSTDNRNFSSVECKLREDIFKFAKVLKENFKEFENSYVAATAPQAGIRESRRIVGLHTITAEEYVGTTHYPDSISRGIHPVDMHASKGTGQHRIDLERPAYVPYRALITADYPNLIVAGRCISADRGAHAALRVMGSCMGLGQAAGVAAAQSVKYSQSVQNIDIEELVSTVRALGAII